MLFFYSVIFIILTNVRLLTMVINDIWNKRSGPGGGTRRLHQDLWGRNRIDTRNKDIFFTRYCTTVIGLFFTNANDNFEAHAIAA